MIAGSVLQSLLRIGGSGEGVQTECRVKDSILCQNQTFSQADTCIRRLFSLNSKNRSLPRTVIIKAYQTWVSLCPLSLNLSWPSPMRPSSHTLTCSSIQHLYNNYTTTIQQPIQQLYNNSYFVVFGQCAPKIMIISFFLLLKLSCPRNTVNMQLLYGCCMSCCIVVV